MQVSELETKQKLDENVYDESSISVLEGLEAVRKRPSMYIGSTGKNGVHHCVYEIVDNSIDEAVNGSCNKIDITINTDNSVTVSDNGRGIPCGAHPIKKISTLEVILATLHAGGKFGQGGYKVSGGLHGVGSSVVNALSSKFEATVHRDGNIYRQNYSEGKKLNEVSIIGKTKGTGTSITFTLDDKIFKEISFDYHSLSNKLRELAFLNKKITITFEDKREGKEQIQEYHYEGGIKQFIEDINENKDIIQSEVCYIEKKIEDCEVEIGFQYTDSYNENLYSFVNNINTIDGGYHVIGFYNGLTKALNDYARKNDLIKEKDENFQKEDIKEGLTSIISIKVPNPEFEGQTKTKLGNTEVQSVIGSIIKDFLEVYLHEKKEIAEQIVEKVKASQEARIVAKKAKDLNKKKNKLGNSKPLPTKFADNSSKDPLESEVFVVEGDSAGGTAKQGRDRKRQAVFPSKGKILNIEKQKLDRILASEEIQIYVNALGAGMGDDFDISKIRYDKTILMTDADVDGAHIRTLWLTFLFRYMRELIVQGHVYIALSPLYKITKGKKEEYAYSDTELQTVLDKFGGKDANTMIQRYKGLGEMDATQLWDTTMNPETRTLQQVTVEDAINADKITTLLMGDKVEPRKVLLKNNSNMLTKLDV